MRCVFCGEKLMDAWIEKSRITFEEAVKELGVDKAKSPVFSRGVACEECVARMNMLFHAGMEGAFVKISREAYCGHWAMANVAESN